MEADRRSEAPGLQKTPSTAGSMNIIMLVLVALPNFSRGYAKRPRRMLTFNGLVSWLRTT